MRHLGIHREGLRSLSLREYLCRFLQLLIFNVFLGIRGDSCMELTSLGSSFRRIYVNRYLSLKSKETGVTTNVRIIDDFPICD